MMSFNLVKYSRPEMSHEILIEPPNNILVVRNMFKEWFIEKKLTYIIVLDDRLVCVSLQGLIIDIEH